MTVPGGLLTAEDDPGSLWRTFCRGKGEHLIDNSPLLVKYGTECSAQGCHHCLTLDCPYAEFIRQYWNHPFCD